LSVVSKILYS